MTNTRPFVRQHTVSPEYQTRMEAALQAIGFSFSEPRRLAEAVLRLSDHYTQNPLAPTPWTEPWAQAASIAYYFPLNYARTRAVAEEAARLGFFSGLESLLDVGSGMGAALHALRDVAQGSARAIDLKTFQAGDISREALHLGLRLGDQPYLTDVMDTRHPSRDWLQNKSHRSMIAASYVLTELESLPQWWLQAEALALVEPSTQDDGRRLMRVRAELLEKGFHVWAPCTHQGACPLLTHSEKDWCHDRIHWAAPAWWTEMEKHLPMKNRTLTFSYLLARKSLSAPLDLRNLARLTGDMLVEKGKTRQSVCRGDEREFLAWFPPRMKKSEGIHLERGSLIRLSDGLEKKANEVRLKHPSEVEEIAIDRDLSAQNPD